MDVTCATGSHRTRRRVQAADTRHLLMLSSSTAHVLPGIKACNLPAASKQTEPVSLHAAQCLLSPVTV
jgi:hypothetical protein